jgi:hypothetical protein
MLGRAIEAEIEVPKPYPPVRLEKKALVFYAPL